MHLKVPSFLAKQQVEISFNKGADENGEETYTEPFIISCRNESCNEVAFLPDGKKVKVTEKLFIFEKLNLFPESIEGICVINGHKHVILKGKKLKNPDGTVNHIVLELM